MENSSRDIIDTAIAAGNFTLLSNAFRAADLVGALKAVGPFTLFAPTDEAFRKLPAGALDALLKDRAKLANILNYHLVPGKLMTDDLMSGDSMTVQGSMLTIAKSEDGMTVGGAKVMKKNVESSNGVMHSIDTVVMPA